VMDYDQLRWWSYEIAIGKVSSISSR
jgi:hypothetical protein